MPSKKNQERQLEDAHSNHINCNGKSFHCIASESLKSFNLKITKPRLAVIQCLESTNSPLSPKEILEKINKEKGIKIDKVSVYRVLESLNELGLIHQVYPSGDYVSCHTVCEKKPSHIILNCLKCHKTNEVNIESQIIDSLFEEVKKKTKFMSMGHTMQINGHCFHCQ